MPMLHNCSVMHAHAGLMLQLCLLLCSVLVVFLEVLYIMAHTFPLALATNQDSKYCSECIPHSLNFMHLLALSVLPTHSLS